MEFIESSRNFATLTLTLFSEGEEWQAVRTLLGKHILHPKAVEAYDTTLNAVVDDLIVKLRRSRHQNPCGLVPNISSEFYLFGLEGKTYLHSTCSLCFYLYFYTVAYEFSIRGQV